MEKHTQEAVALRQELSRLENPRIADRLMDLVSRLVGPVVSCVRVEVVLPPERFGESPRHRLFTMQFGSHAARRQSRIDWIQKRLREAPCTCPDCVGLERSLTYDMEASFLERGGLSLYSRV